MKTPIYVKTIACNTLLMFALTAAPSMPVYADSAPMLVPESTAVTPEKPAPNNTEKASINVSVQPSQVNGAPTKIGIDTDTLSASANKSEKTEYVSTQAEERPKPQGYTEGEKVYNNLLTLFQNQQQQNPFVVNNGLEAQTITVDTKKLAVVENNGEYTTVLPTPPEGTLLTLTQMDIKNLQVYIGHENNLQPNAAPNMFNGPIKANNPVLNPLIKLVTPNGNTKMVVDPGKDKSFFNSLAPTKGNTLKLIYISATK